MRQVYNNNIIVSRLGVDYISSQESFVPTDSGANAETRLSPSNRSDDRISVPADVCVAHRETGTKRGRSRRFICGTARAAIGCRVAESSGREAACPWSASGPAGPGRAARLEDRARRRSARPLPPATSWWNLFRHLIWETIICMMQRRGYSRDAGRKTENLTRKACFFGAQPLWWYYKLFTAV